MTGFRNFVLRGNLIDIAVAFVMAAAFAIVVSTFVQWMTGLMPDSADNIFSNDDQSFGAFLNALIAFVLLAVVVYFFVVLPYLKAKERWFPGDDGKPDDIALLEEIRDLLQAQNNRPGGL
jgi:large conductance mechanosensitive channel